MGLVGESRFRRGSSQRSTIENHPPGEMKAALHLVGVRGKPDRRAEGAQEVEPAQPAERGEFVEAHFASRISVDQAAGLGDRKWQGSRLRATGFDEVRNDFDQKAFHCED